MKNLFRKNLVYLKDINNETFASIGLIAGLSANTVSYWVHKNSEPKLAEVELIAQYFEISLHDIVYSDLENVALNKKAGVLNKQENVALKVAPSVALTAPNNQYRAKPLAPIMMEDAAPYGTNMQAIPIADIAVAAGGGYYNGDHVENVDKISLPVQFLKRNCTYLCVLIKGASMAPTLQDGGYVIMRLLDKSEWATMPDERIFVVTDKEGKSYLKRVKNRFKKGLIILRSDSPDQATYPNFNLKEEDINTIWYVEWYLSAKMPNIHDQFYSRLQALEDRVDELSPKPARI